MIPIPITEFISGVSVPVDLYVRLGDRKFILIAKSGTKTQKSQLSTYHDKQVDYLWVRKEQYYKIARQNIAIAGIAVTSDKLDVRHKTHVITAATRSVFKQLDHMGISIESYNQAKQISEATLSLVESHSDLAAIMKGLAECSDELLRHSMAVSILSLIIAQTLKWENKVTLEKLAIGALLHDVGKKTLPKELLTKPISQMTTTEIQLYETHSYRGMQLLLSLGIVPDDVVSIVYEHHENSIGQGFPRRIRDVVMHPLAKIVALANQFINLTLENVNCPVPKNPREALLYIELTMGQPFNKEAFKALQAIVSRAELDAA